MQHSTLIKNVFYCCRFFYLRETETETYFETRKVKTRILLLQQWEMIVLNVLEWDLSAVTPYSILDHLLRSITLDQSFELETVRKHAETFCALAATEHTFSQKRPSVVAVACLGAALRGLNNTGLERMLQSLQISSGVQLVSYRTLFV